MLSEVESKSSSSSNSESSASEKLEEVPVPKALATPAVRRIAKENNVRVLNLIKCITLI